MKLKALLFLLLLPLFWIGVGHTHDWGDDFAQYLIQASNISNHNAQEQNGLVYFDDQNTLPYALKAYPVGFPLFLAPVFFYFGLDIYPYLILMTIFLLMAAQRTFKFSKKEFSETTALLLALLFAYNAFSLLLKREILSEWPFVVFLLSVFLQLRKDRDKDYIKAGLTAGFLMSIRLAGIVILPAVIISIWLSNQPVKQKFFRLGAFSFFSVAVFLILNALIFHLNPMDMFSFYNTHWSHHDLSFFTNLSGTMKNIAAAICLPMESDAWTIVTAAILLTGLAVKAKDNAPSWWFFIFFILLISFYPDTNSLHRLFFPVLPLALFYFVHGLFTIVKALRAEAAKEYVLAAISGLCIAYSIYFEQMQAPADGPYSKSAAEAFQYIREYTPKDAIIVFPRARAMSLYGKRRAAFLSDNISDEENRANLEKIGSRFILYPDERSGAFNKHLQSYLIKNKKNYHTVWSNGTYVLLAVNDPSRLAMK